MNPIPAMNKTVIALIAAFCGMLLDGAISAAQSLPTAPNIVLIISDDHGTAVRAELAEYYQAVARMDQGIGILLDSLKVLGLWENTLVIYISDNGIAFPGAKTTVYEPALRLPCIVKAPGKGSAGEASDAMVSWVDLTPTILDYAGMLEKAGAELVQGRKELKGFRGRSFRPVVEDPSKEIRQEVFASHTLHQATMYYPMRALITKKYKLIWNLAHQQPYPAASDLWESAAWQWALVHPETLVGGKSMDAFTHRPAFEFYDLENDPLETNNLCSAPEYAWLVDDYKARLKQFQEKTDDPWRIKWE